MKRFLACLAIMMIAISTAGAEGWDVSDYLSMARPVPGEEQQRFAQSIGLTYENESIRADVVDAVFDGFSFAVAVEITNKTDVPLHLFTAESTDNAEFANANYYGLDGWIIYPDKPQRAGLNGLLPPNNNNGDGALPTPTDAFDMRLTITVHALSGNVALFPNEYETGDYRETVRQFADEQAGLGNVVVNSLGAAFGSYDFLAGYGLIGEASTLEVPLHFQNNTKAVDLISDGKPIEKHNDTYTLRIISATAAPNTIFLDMESACTTEEAVRQMNDMLENDQYSLWFHLNNEAGESDWMLSTSLSQYEKLPSPDSLLGSVTKYHITIACISAMPRTLTLVPVLRKTKPPYTSIEYTEEALTIEVPAMAKD